MQRPTSRLFTQLSALESQFGSVLYVRIDAIQHAPEHLLADQTVYLAPGGFLDIVVDHESSMGMDRVSYTQGVRALRKPNKGLLTYRFEIRTDDRVGSCYLIQCQDAPTPFQRYPWYIPTSSFAFTIQVA